MAMKSKAWLWFAAIVLFKLVHHTIVAPLEEHAYLLNTLSQQQRVLDQRVKQLEGRVADLNARLDAECALRPIAPVKAPPVLVESTTKEGKRTFRFRSTPGFDRAKADRELGIKAAKKR